MDNWEFYFFFFKFPYQAEFSPVLQAMAILVIVHKDKPLNNYKGMIQTITESLGNILIYVLALG